MSDMSDLSTTPPTSEAAPAAKTRTFRMALKKRAARVQDWFTIQAIAVKALVVLTLVLIPLTGVYSISLAQKQARIAEQVKIMGADTAPAVGAINTDLPIVFGTGSLLGFLDANPADRITVVYKPLMWNISERIVIIESAGKQYAYYPSDMESKIFSDRAVQAKWGSKLAFVPRADLDKPSLVVLERLEERFGSARPQSEKDGWKAGVSGVLPATLTLGLLGFLFFQRKGQF